MKVVLSSGVVAAHSTARPATAKRLRDHSGWIHLFPGRGLLCLSPARPEANDKLPHHVALTRLGFQWSDTWGVEVLG